MSPDPAPVPPPVESSAPATPPALPEADVPAIRRIKLGPLQTVFAGTLAVLAVLYTLHFARAILVPIALALLLSVILAPVMAGLRRLRIPSGIGAALLVLGIVGAGATAAVLLNGPATQWLARAPEVALRLKTVVGESNQVVQAAREVESALGSAEAVPVRMEGSKVGEAVFYETSAFLMNGAIVVFLLFFLLAGADQFHDRVSRLFPDRGLRRSALGVARRAQQQVSTYLLTITVINMGLAAAVAVALWLVGLPNPVLWGIVAGFLNYVPYFGPLVSALLIGMVGFVAEETLRGTLLPPAIYLAINSLEAFVVTPTLVGLRLRLSPVAVLLSLLAWGWLWGLPGAVMAVPLLVIFQVVCAHIGPLRPFALMIQR